MPALKRIKTKYPGVVYVEGNSPATGKPERIYYLRYRRDGKQVEEKAGREHLDDMTPARASMLRAERMQGKDQSNQEKRDKEREAKETEEGRWTISKLWAEYKATNPQVKAIDRDEDRFNCYLKAAFGRPGAQGACAA